MNDYYIYMDVSGDVDPKIAADASVRFIPMEYSLGDEMRKCKGMEADNILKLFYDGQRKGELTKTTPISPFMYEEIIAPALEDGKSVLYLSLSSGLSNTYQSALLAKKELEERYPGQKFCPVDTLAATGGMGVLCERAITNKRKGMSLEENLADITAATHKICHWFMVQDLMYLKRGGRISGATAVVGTMLNVKPILRIAPDGKLVTINKKRGNKQAMLDLVADYEENRDPKSTDPVYVIDADDKETGDNLAAALLEKHPELTIRRMKLSPIIGAHTGPGMAAICHMGK